MNKKYLLTLLAITLLQTTASANKITDSSIGQGIISMIKDTTSFLMILAPLIGGLCIIGFLIRRKMADEMSAKTWNSRIITVIICTVGVLSASGILNLVASYFGG